MGVQEGTVTPTQLSFNLRTNKDNFQTLTVDYLVLACIYTNPCQLKITSFGNNSCYVLTLKFPPPIESWFLKLALEIN